MDESPLTAPNNTRAALRIPPSWMMQSLPKSKTFQLIASSPSLPRGRLRDGSQWWLKDMIRQKIAF
jgi:hypothetical protein